MSGGTETKHAEKAHFLNRRWCSNISFSLNSQSCGHNSPFKYVQYLKTTVRDKNRLSICEAFET